MPTSVRGLMLKFQESGLSQDGNKNRGMVKSDPWVYISDPSKSPQLSEVKCLDQSQNGSEANFREDHPFLMVDTSHSL